MNKEELLKAIILEIASSANKPELEIKNDSKGRLFDLKVDQKDMKVFIGKNGNGIKSLRSVIKMMYKDDRTSLIIDQHGN